MMIKYLIQKEFLQIRRNAFLPRLVVMFPIMIMCVMPWVMNQEVKNIRVCVVDVDHTAQRIIHSIEQSRYFIFTGQKATYAEAMKDIERQVEKAETEAKQAVENSGVIEKVTAMAENLGLTSADDVLPVMEQTVLSDSVVTSVNPIIALEEQRNLTDANLVKADLAESGRKIVRMTKSVTELLDSTMQAVGARKIAEGTYVGHFQPNLNSDTVRIAQAKVLDYQSRLIASQGFAKNTASPYAYNITLSAETRKERTGYYIRFLQPVSSTLRHYDRKRVDPKMLSTVKVTVQLSPAEKSAI